jgi:hypothetical protein
MIVNDKDKFVIDYFPINSNNSKDNNTETKEKLCETILNNFNEHPKDQNNLYDLTKWDEYKDNILKQLVLFYNFDFKKISQVFDKLCKIKRDINQDGEEIVVYNEKILRYHWSFIHARRFFGNKTGEEFYILNKNENNEDINTENKSKNEITNEKNLVNTVNINSLNNEKDLDSYFDKLLNQKMDKERTKIFEMELKENMKSNNLFPINSGENNREKNVDEIINNMKQIEKEKEKKKVINKDEIDDNE